MRLIQLSDIHLTASYTKLVRGSNPLKNFKLALQEVISYCPDILLITGDICHDESKGGYLQCQKALEVIPNSVELAVIAGNHDNPTLMKQIFDRRIIVGPSELNYDNARVLILCSHFSNHDEGRLGVEQLDWLKERVFDRRYRGKPLLIALHHQPLKVGDKFWDSIGLIDSSQLIEILKPIDELKAVIFGHMHQHWRGELPGRKDVQLLASPSTLCSFPAIQPCPLGKPDTSGARLIEIDKQGNFNQKLLRWE